MENKTKAAASKPSPRTAVGKQDHNWRTRRKARRRSEWRWRWKLDCLLSWTERLLRNGRQNVSHLRQGVWVDGFQIAVHPAAKGLSRSPAWRRRSPPRSASAIGAIASAPWPRHSHSCPAGLNIGRCGQVIAPGELDAGARLRRERPCTRPARVKRWPDTGFARCPRSARFFHSRKHEKRQAFHLTSDGRGRSLIVINKQAPMGKHTRTTVFEQMRLYMSSLTDRDVLVSRGVDGTTGTGIRGRSVLSRACPRSSAHPCKRDTSGQPQKVWPAFALPCGPGDHGRSALGAGGRGLCLNAQRRLRSGFGQARLSAQPDHVAIGLPTFQLPGVDHLLPFGEQEVGAEGMTTDGLRRFGRSYGLNSGIARIINSSNNGTVNAISPCAGL